MHLEALDEKSREIFSRLSYFPTFYLAGGTALALQIGHRKSFDFDLFSQGPIPSTLFDEAKGGFPKSPIALAVNNRDELTVFVDGVKVSFLSYPFPVVLPFIEYKEKKLLAAEEIAATKAYSIGRRGSFKDYVDLYFVLSEAIASLKEIIALAEKKYHSEFNARLFLEQLLYTEDITDTHLVFLKRSVTKDEVQKFFEGEIRKMELA